MQAALEITATVLVHRTGRYRGFIWAGIMLMALGAGLYIYFGTNTSVAVVAGLKIGGTFGPALFQAPMVALQDTVSRVDSAVATASLGFVRSVVIALSVVVGVVVFQSSMDTRQSSLTAAGISESALEALSGSQAAVNVGILQSI